MDHCPRRRLFTVHVPAVLLLWSVAASSPALAHAGSIGLGFVSYDIFIPADGDAPGSNIFGIGNLTGDPALGGFALASDFPSFTPVSFLESSLTLIVEDTSLVRALGDIEPGFVEPLPSLQFADTGPISLLVFSATLSTTSFRLENGSTFLADSAALNLTLLPAFGSALMPGFDFGVLAVEGQVIPAPVPEPGTLALLATGLIGLGIRRRVRTQSSAERRARHVPRWSGTPRA